MELDNLFVAHLPQAGVLLAHLLHGRFDAADVFVRHQPRVHGNGEAFTLDQHSRDVREAFAQLLFGGIEVWQAAHSLFVLKM